MLRNVIIASESKITASVLQHSLLILRNMMLISTLPVQMLVFSADLCGLFSLLGTISKPHSIHSLPAYLLNRYVNQLPPLAADAPHSPPDQHCGFWSGAEMTGSLRGLIASPVRQSTYYHEVDRWVTSMKIGLCHSTDSLRFCWRQNR